MTPIAPDVPVGSRAVVFAKDQPQYTPLPAVVSPEGIVTTEWMLSAEELDHMMQGGRLRLRLFTFNQPLQPVILEVVPPACGYRGE